MGGCAQVICRFPIVRAGCEHLGILCPWLPGAHLLQMPGDDCIILLSENATRFPLLRRLLQLLCIMNVFSVGGPVVIFHQSVSCVISEFTELYLHFFVFIQFLYNLLIYQFILYLDLCYLYFSVEGWALNWSIWAQLREKLDSEIIALPCFGRSIGCWTLPNLCFYPFRKFDKLGIEKSWRKCLQITGSCEP